MRKLGKPEDLAGATLFLISEMSGFITVTVLPIADLIFIAIYERLYKLKISPNIKMINRNLNKIIIAVDSYKESLASQEAAEIIARRLRSENRNLEIEKIPVADGGEGTVDAIINCIGGRTLYVNVKNPLMRDISASYGILPDNKTAVIEIAQASGLTLLNKSERNPIKTTSFGTGEIILNAVKNGCNNILLGLGGSATNDCGIGAVSALGINFFDKSGNKVEANNKALKNVYSFDISKKKISDNIKITILCDVQNSLLGRNGATYVYGKQKGADKNMLKQMEENMVHYASVVENTQKCKLANIIGMGAAGGIGFSLAAFFNAQLVSGINFINKIIDIEGKIKSADLIITGEGKLDNQSFNNKLPVGISAISKKYNKPVIAVVGIDKSSDKMKNKYFDKVFSLTDEFEISKEESIKKAEFYLSEIMGKIIKEIIPLVK